MIIKNPNFHKLCETHKLILGYVFEYAYLVRKKDNKEIYVGDFYGDPICGLIDVDDNWCLVGGNKLYLWKEDRGAFEIKDEALSWISNVRQKSAHEAEILIDPWSDQGAVWGLNVVTLQKYKMREYKLNSEHSGQIEW